MKSDTVNGRMYVKRAFLFPWGEEGTACDWLGLYLAHDREHAQGIRSTLG